MKSAPHRHPCSATTPVETIRGYPSTLRIFKIGCSPYWYARVFVYGKYRKASLKTTDKTEAVHLAKLFFMEQFGIQAAVKQQLTGQRFSSIAEAMMAADERKVRRGERSESLATSNRCTYRVFAKLMFRYAFEALGFLGMRLGDAVGLPSPCVTFVTSTQLGAVPIATAICSGRLAVKNGPPITIPSTES